MPNYVQLNDNNIVVGVTQASGIIDLSHMIEVIDFDASLLGKKYESGVFIDVPAATIPNIITKIALLHRLTDNELSSILAAAKTDTDVEVWKMRLDASSSFNLDTDITKAGISMLVTKGLLTQARSIEILTAPIQLDER